RVAVHRRRTRGRTRAAECEHRPMMAALFLCNVLLEAVWLALLWRRASRARRTAGYSFRTLYWWTTGAAAVWLILVQVVPLRGGLAIATAVSPLPILVALILLDLRTPLPAA